MKQVILMRTDLGMRKGKMVAQGAHASMKATVLHMDNPCVKEWLADKFTKAVVKVGSAEELMEYVNTAAEHRVIAETIVDEGRTTFDYVPTLTCAAIGPDTEERIDKITGGLKLL